jgi:TIR domain-containing protein
MSSSVPAVFGRIFISYRREDTGYPAAWLFGRLVAHFGEGQVFKDVDAIRPGDDFAEVIRTAVGSCDVLLVLIGAYWLTITDDSGQRRIDSPDDFVRLEVQAALDRDIRVIPILAGAPRMPRAVELPDGLADLAGRQALTLDPAHFDSDADKLLPLLDQALSDAMNKQELMTGRALEGSLDAPRDGDEVGGRVEVRGHVTGWRPSHRLWIVHRRERQGSFWLKPPEIRPDDLGNFSAVVFEGGPSGQLIISLLAVSPARGRDFEKWQERGDLTGQYPGIYPASADNELARVTVSYALNT